MVYNVLYNVSYSCKMYASIIDLIGSTKIASASYAYNIRMYCIHRLMADGKLPVRSMNTSPVSGSARPISTSTEFVVSSLEGEEYVSISSAK